MKNNRPAADAYSAQKVLPVKLIVHEVGIQTFESNCPGESKQIVAPGFDGLLLAFPVGHGVVGLDREAVQPVSRHETKPGFRCPSSSIPHE